MAQYEVVRPVATVPLVPGDLLTVTSAGGYTHLWLRPILPQRTVAHAQCDVDAIAAAVKSGALRLVDLPDPWAAPARPHLVLVR